MGLKCLWLLCGVLSNFVLRDVFFAVLINFSQQILKFLKASEERAFLLFLLFLDLLPFLHAGLADDDLVTVLIKKAHKAIHKGDGGLTLSDVVHFEHRRESDINGVNVLLGKRDNDSLFRLREKM